ncbi:MAG TPA: hypothetical protein VM536_21095 [Chloroflexia bacterium]|nr:hypothetical protein [Chloroflexia bacterium]
MRARRPPLAEIDAAVLWAALRRGEWQVVAPWLLLLAGFCAVLAGLGSFFWLTTRDTPDDRLVLLLGLAVFAVFLYRRLSKHPAAAAGTVALLLALAGLVFGLWWLALAAGGDNVWVGLLGVLIECGLGIGLGLLGINQLAARE